MFLPKIAAGLPAVFFFLSASAKPCPPLGPVLPAPLRPSQSETLKAAARKLESGLDSQFSQQLNTSGVSIAVKSIHEDGPLFNYHFTPPTLSGIGTDKIDEKTIYRVGSVSKLFPILAVLQSSVDLDDSVLKYIPRLGNVTQRSGPAIPWAEITIGSLASHLSGLATDTAMDLATFPVATWTDMGLPPVPKGTGPNCSGLPGTKPCTEDDLVEGVNRRPLVYLPYTSPSYSNVAYALLSMVVEAATGKSFQDAIQSSIYDVVGMPSSSFNGPVSSFNKTGFVPLGETTWNITLGSYESAGGMFSNTVDLVAFAEAILQNRLLSPCKTRQWLKPVTHTSSFGVSVGGPWEIFRSDNLTSDGRIVDVYIKSGDLGLYNGYVGMIPDYDVVVSVLTGGSEVAADQFASPSIVSSVLRALVPAIEKAGREEASSPGAGFVGTFHDESTESSIALKMDAGPGLVVSNLTVRGFDVLSHATQYNLDGTDSGSSQPPPAQMRIYPSNSADGQTRGGESNWLGVVDPMSEADKDAVDEQLFFKDGSCQAWLNLDRVVYDYLSLWEFAFVRGGDGKIAGIKNDAFNVTMARVQG